MEIAVTGRRLVRQSGVDPTRLEQELAAQAEQVADLMRRGVHGAELEAEVDRLLASFEIWRVERGLQDSGVWPDDVG